MRQRSQHSALHQRQILHVFVEIRLCRCPYTVRIVTQIDRVEIGLQYLLFRQSMFYKDGIVSLPDLSGHRPFFFFACQEDVSGKLLGYGTGTGDLGLKAGFGAVPDCAEYTDDIESVMIPESLVLYRYEGVFKVLGKLRIVDVGTQAFTALI